MRLNQLFRLALALCAGVSFPSVLSPAQQVPVKVACVGDSITAGPGLPASQTYPGRLQHLLGTNHLVRNLGVGDATVLKRGDVPYWNTAAYRQSLEWLPDVVIIKLGSNDAESINWRFGTNFLADYEDLVSSYRSLSSSPRILLGTPAPIFGNSYPVEAGRVATNLAPAIRQMAQRLDAGLIDFHRHLEGRPEWFPDSVHPNTRGAAVMAALVCDALLGPPRPPEVSLALARASSNRVLLSWPAGGGGYVLQTSPNLLSNWTVADLIPSRAGGLIQATNTSSGRRFFRLWHPARSEP